MFGELTLAATDHEVLTGPAKCTADHKFALFLTSESPDNISGFQIDQLDLALRQVHEYVFRVPADGYRGSLAWKREAVVFFVSAKIENVDIGFGIDGDQSSAVRADRAICYPEIPFPHVQRRASDAPETELGARVERRCDK